jgi:hypothetical protein
MGRGGNRASNASAGWLRDSGRLSGAEIRFDAGRSKPCARAGSKGHGRNQGKLIVSAVSNVARLGRPNMARAPSDGHGAA